MGSIFSGSADHVHKIFSLLGLTKSDRRREHSTKAAIDAMTGAYILKYRLEPTRLFAGLR